MAHDVVLRAATQSSSGFFILDSLSEPPGITRPFRLTDISSIVYRAVLDRRSGCRTAARRQAWRHALGFFGRLFRGWRLRRVSGPVVLRGFPGRNGAEHKEQWRQNQIGERYEQARSGRDPRVG